MSVQIPFTKSMDPADLDHLGWVLPIVEAHFDQASPQHPVRQWEYGLALRTWVAWEQMVDDPLLLYPILDVGGAGSPFTLMFTHAGGVRVIDPAVNTTLEAAGIAPASIGAIFCLSVLEHADDPLALLTAAAHALAPGGLLFLTMDGWNGVGADTAHFHWMRKRIYTPASWKALAQTAEALGLGLFGGADWGYRGDQLYGSYTFFSLALIKGGGGRP